MEGLRQTVPAHILIWRLSLCVNKRQRGKNFLGIGRMLESYETEQEGETEAGLWGHEYMQMANKTVKGNLKSGRLSLHLYSAGELALSVGRQGKGNLAIGGKRSKFFWLWKSSNSAIRGYS